MFPVMKVSVFAKQPNKKYPIHIVWNQFPCLCCLLANIF